MNGSFSGYFKKDGNGETRFSMHFSFLIMKLLENRLLKHYFLMYF